MVRLAEGVVPGRGLRVWCLGPGGAPVEAGAGLPPGAPVAVGPAEADSAEVRSALKELARLTAADGPVVAGADIQLCGDLRSARLDGGRGDRRDAVLAALRVLGLEGADRLGDRKAILVALFGPEATKRVAAAANQAVGEGRWAALHLACAASDLLGPEQLETILGLAAGEGIDPVPGGMASVLAGHLARTLEGYPRKRRLDLLLDLWERVLGNRRDARRRERRRASQGRQSREDDLRRRHEHYEDELLLDHVRATFGPKPTLAQAARFIPGAWYWSARMNRAVNDALAATALLRAAAAVSDHGLQEGLTRCRDELAAAAALIDSKAAGQATRRVPGLTGLPARPGCYVRDLHTRLERHSPTEPKTAAFIRQRLAKARDYGIAVLLAVAPVVWDVFDVYSEAELPNPLRGWASRGRRDWRAAAGYARPPAEWEQPVLFGGEEGERARTLAERLAEHPDGEPAEVETVGDLLWYAELGDALALLHGHDAAEIEYSATLPHISYDPSPPEPAPLTPRLESIPLAAAGTAQLVSLGAQPPQRCRTWTELADGLMAAAAVAEALTGDFQLPAALSPLDGAVIPGTRTRLEWARNPRKLAEWSAYMGNCIAGEHYAADAALGKCALAALRDSKDRVVANLEIRPTGRGWRVAELRARFNADPGTELESRAREWVAALPSPEPPAEPPAEPAEQLPDAGPRARRASRSTRLFHEVRGPLGLLAERAMGDPGTAEAESVLAELARRIARPGHEPADPVAALTALRRAAPERLTDACRDALPETGLAGLWAATGARPLARALAELDPGLRNRFARLDLLLQDAPLPGSLRKLARSPGVAPARSMELVTRRVRTAIGRLACQGDPVLAQCVERRPATPVLCTLAIAATSRAGAARTDGAQGTPLPPMAPVTPAKATSVPGFPLSDLTDADGPWQRAWPDAYELGADHESFWAQIAAEGLVVPAAWLPNGGWPALWARAARS